MKPENYGKLVNATKELQDVIKAGDATTTILKSYLSTFCAFTLASKRVSYFHVHPSTVQMAHDIEVDHLRLELPKLKLIAK